MKLTVLCWGAFSLVSHFRDLVTEQMSGQNQRLIKCSLFGTP
jgi:hypothetical protein